MYRIITPIAVLAASLILALPAFGKSQPVEPQWMQALEARSQELNRQYGLGQHDAALRALRFRSEGLNRLHELGTYASSTVNNAIEARERAFAAGRDQQPTSAIDARERAFGEKRNVQLAGATGPDVFERTVQARERSRAGDHFVGDDRFRIDPSTSRPDVTTTVSGSGTEIEWPQVGIGLGLGIVLMLGLMLAVRATRQPPLAH